MMNTRIPVFTFFSLCISNLILTATTAYCILSHLTPDPIVVPAPTLIEDITIFNKDGKVIWQGSDKAYHDYLDIIVMESLGCVQPEPNPPEPKPDVTPQPMPTRRGVPGDYVIDQWGNRYRR